MTLGQTLNTCSGALFILPSKGEKGPCSSLFRTASCSKGQETESGRKRVGRYDVREPTYRSPPGSSFLATPIPIPTFAPLIPPFLHRSGDLSTYLILSGAPSSAGEVKGGGDRQEAGARLGVDPPGPRAGGGGSDQRSALPGWTSWAVPVTSHRPQPSASSASLNTDRPGRDPPRGWG